jgi:putative FmdB family regulatory protein
MPTYPYACTVCDHRFEVVQSFTDDALTVCPQCSGRLRKVFGSVGVVFKGSGFYRTDSRSASASSVGGSHAHNGSSHDTHAGSKDGKAAEHSTATKDGGSKAPATAAAGGSSSSTSASSTSSSASSAA